VCVPCMYNYACTYIYTRMCYSCLVYLLAPCAYIRTSLCSDRYRYMVLHIDL